MLYLQEESGPNWFQVQMREPVLRTAPILGPAPVPLRLQERRTRQAREREPAGGGRQNPQDLTALSDRVSQTNKQYKVNRVVNSTWARSDSRDLRRCAALPRGH